MAKKQQTASSAPPEPNPKLNAGIGVTIQRSNGRTHAATIMTVNILEQNCQVEWEEDKEIKAKQISLAQIYQLNTHLQPGYSDNSNENSAVPSPSSGVDITNVKSTKKSNAAAARNNVNPAEGSQLPSKQNNSSSNRVPENGEDVGAANKVPLKPWQRKKNMPGLSHQKKHNKQENNNNSNEKMDSSPPEPEVQPAPRRKLRNNPNESAESSRPTSRGISRPNSVSDNRKNAINNRLNARAQAKSPIRSKTPLDRNRPSSGHGIKASNIPIKKTSNPTNNLQSSEEVPENNNNFRNVKNARQSLVVGNIAKIEEKRKQMRQEHAQQRQQNKQRRQKYQHNSNWEYAEFVDEYRNGIEMNPLQKGDPLLPRDRRITVAVRKRPVNNKESERGEVDCCSVTTKDIIMVHEPKQKVDLTKYLENQEFRFDYIFNQDSDNELVYKYTAAPLVKSVCQGGMATCFAYGQTGTGKTHTMGGEFRGKNQNVDGGLYYFCARDLFLRLKRA